MADDQYRGLLTEREKEILAGEVEVSDNYYSRTKSRVRNKIQSIGDDLELLRECEPELAGELRHEICDNH